MASTAWMENSDAMTIWGRVPVKNTRYAPTTAELGAIDHAFANGYRL